MEIKGNVPNSRERRSYQDLRHLTRHSLNDIEPKGEGHRRIEKEQFSFAEERHQVSQICTRGLSFRAMVHTVTFY